MAYASSKLILRFGSALVSADFAGSNSKRTGSNWFFLRDSKAPKLYLFHAPRALDGQAPITYPRATFAQRQLTTPHVGRSNCRCAAFGKTPGRFNTVHVVFTTSELIFMMMNPMMAVTIEDQAIVRSPAVRVDRAISQNLTFNDGPQGVTRAVIDNFDVHTTPSFQQAYDRNLATSAPSTFAAYSPRSEIAFIDLNLPSEGLTLIQRQLDDSSTKSSIKLMGRVLVIPNSHSF
jgi:hypothetical protein